MLLGRRPSAEQVPAAASASSVAPSPAPRSRALWPTRVDQPSAGFSSIIIVTYLFVLFGRVPELASSILGAPLFLAKILSVLGLAAAVVGRGLRRAFLTPAGFYFAAFTVWIVLSAPFSVWQGGSVMLLGNWLRNYTAFIMAASLITSVRDVRRAMYGIGCGALLISFAALVSGSTESRLQIELFSEGTLANPNYIAIYLMVGAPSVLLLAWSARHVFIRTLAWAGSLLIVAVTVLTGSRMGLIVIAVLALLVFLRLSAFKKAIFTFIGAGIFFALLILVPGAVRDRFEMMLNLEPEPTTLAPLDDMESPEQPATGQAEAAAGSSRARRRILITSLRTTWEHPLLGVGPGMFSVATGAETHWQETHNTYTQISAELGIPALFFYLAVLWRSARPMFLHFRRAPDRDAPRSTANLAYFIFVALCVFAISAVFASLAYDFLFPAIAGVAVAFDDALRREASTPSAPQAAV